MRECAEDGNGVGPAPAPTASITALRRNHPHNKSKVDGEEVSGLLDTGCSKTILGARFSQYKPLKQEKSVRVMAFDGGPLCAKEHHGGGSSSWEVCLE
ncbi:Hypothetical protein FKW44_018678 [Caligus rogercresseyi]|uniref:Uncharacterized protein n=1 Tax=Caligus rogercresseyi TaxID=217165 RepID=A0A7T8GVD5_CALRO|nr:Hypothetical protein FKW44_018678 [Caligus rogercresseyi]